MSMIRKYTKNTKLKNDEKVLYKWFCIKRDNIIYKTDGYYESREQAQENEDYYNINCLILEKDKSTGIVVNSDLVFV